MIASKLITLAASSVLMQSFPIQSFAADTFSSADAQEVRALFLRQASAETAHDIVAIGGVWLQSDQDNPIP